MKTVFIFTAFVILSLELYSLDTDNQPQPFEYFQPNNYANKFHEKSAFVEVPAETGAVIGDTVGIAGGWPLGIVLGMPVAFFTESDDPMTTGMYWGWLCLGLPVRLISAQAVSAPFFMIKKICWDLPVYCFGD